MMTKKSSRSRITKTLVAVAALAASAALGAEKGVGPVQEVKLTALDAKLAAKGKKIFDSKCASCHKFEERYAGPALAGVTQRRAPEWIMNMILNPAEMVEKDETAKGLFEEYLIKMSFQNVTKDDARALLELFRENDAKKK